MNKIVKLSFFGVFAVLCLLGCTKKAPSAQWIDPNKISQGPIVHSKLSDEQKARIAHLQKTFSEVDPTPLEKWTEDFMRDQNPDSEIKTWEGMAEPYRIFTQKHKLSLAGKKEVFQIVLLRSGASDEETLQKSELKILTKTEAREILSNYHEPPKPIEVKKKK